MPDEIQTDQPDDARPAPRQPQAIALSGQGVMTPASHDELWRQCAIWHKSRLCPESFRDVSQVFFAHQTLASLGVNPLPWLRNTAFIKSSFAIFGDLPLALVNMAGKLACPPREFFISKDYEEICVSNRNLDQPIFAAVCQMWPKAQHNQMQERTFTIQDAKDAGKLPAKSPSPWALYTGRMCQLKARGRLIKDLFPEVLNGVAQGEYDHDEMAGNMQNAKRVGIITTSPDPVDLNAAYGGEA